MKSILVLLLGLAVTATASLHEQTNKPAIHQSGHSHWSTYRPNLYFGVRSLDETSPLFGILWSPFQSTEQSIKQSIETIRHDAEERDHVKQYSYIAHTSDYAKQLIDDSLIGINITNEFLSVDPSHWHANLMLETSKQQSHNQPDYQSYSVFWYITLQDSDNQSMRWDADAQSIIVSIKQPDHSIKEQHYSVRLIDPSLDQSTDQSNNQCSHPTINLWTRDGRVSHETSDPLVHQSSNQSPWDAKHLVKTNLINQINQQYSYAQRHIVQSSDPAVNQANNQKIIEELFAVMSDQSTSQPNDQSNFMVVQHIVELPCELSFEMHEIDQPNHSNDQSINRFTYSELKEMKDARLTDFNEHFDRRFPFTFPFNQSLDQSTIRSIDPINRSIKPVKRSNDQFKSMAKAALSNMLGGIGFFQGTSLIEVVRSVNQTKRSGSQSNNQTIKRKVFTETIPSTKLLSAVPSRSFFPRGFLWDEGFHQLLLSHQSINQSVDILGSWLDLIFPGPFQHLINQSNNQPIDQSSIKPKDKQSNAQSINEAIKFTGWLPREQILGPEARKRVPDQFQVQRPYIANPPTLILAIGRLVTRVMERYDNQFVIDQSIDQSVDQSTDQSIDQSNYQSNNQEIMSGINLLIKFMHKYFPILESHVDWYFRTQTVALPVKQSNDEQSVTDQSENQLSNESGQTPRGRSLTSATAFRWSGRSIDHCLASGLDDYPRAMFIPKRADRMIPAVKQSSNNQSNSQVEWIDQSIDGNAHEGHVDLHSWMIALTQCMSHFSKFMHRFDQSIDQSNTQSNSGQLDEELNVFSSQLDQLDQSNNQTLNQTIDWKLVSQQYAAKSNQLIKTLYQFHFNYSNNQFCDFAYQKGVRKTICHDGYVAYIPYMLGLIPLSIDQTNNQSINQPINLVKMIESLSNPDIFSDFGIRSLSQKSPKFRTNENYWRGEIWMPLNYLIIQSSYAYRGLINRLSDCFDVEQKTETIGLIDRLIDGLKQTINYDDDQSINQSIDQNAKNIFAHTSPLFDYETINLSINESNKQSICSQLSYSDYQSIKQSVNRFYQSIRSRVIHTVTDGWINQGFLYEQYNSTDGRGQKSHPFTGWTALVVNLMTEKF